MSETVRITGGDPLALGSLHEWLVRSPEVTRHGRPELVAESDEEWMADTVAVIALVVSGVSALADIMAACRTWREARTPPPAITVTIELTGDDDESAA